MSMPAHCLTLLIAGSHLSDVSAQQTVAPLHMQPGEVANRILSVGSTKRAILLAEELDSQQSLFQLESGRGFLTITGVMAMLPGPCHLEDIGGQLCSQNCLDLPFALQHWQGP